MIILSIWFTFFSCLSDVTSLSCGIDGSPSTDVYEGIARIETYPWLGVLYYPYRGQKFTTVVVLVTRQFVLAAANEIDKLPKEDFRANARVVIGHNCTGPYIGVRDYTYHPDYSKTTYSTLAIIQLEVDHTKIELRPICRPPTYFKDQDFYAMVLSDNCKVSKVRIHKMRYVSPDQCKSYYRRSGLGFGVYGPGCQAPARFLDYGMYHEWVERNVARIGRLAITALADNHLVIRRNPSNIQRFGPCDQEEMKNELYTDETKLKTNKPYTVIRHKVSIVANAEYSCVVLKADYGKHKVTLTKPKVRIRRWYSSGGSICHQYGYFEMHFYIEVTVIENINLKVTAYGQDAKFINPEDVYAYMNKFKADIPYIANYTVIKKLVNPLKTNSKYPMFGKNIKTPEHRLY